MPCTSGYVSLNRVDGKCMMPKSLLTCFLVGIMIIGCASIGDMNRLNRFNEIAKDYEIAMRWSDFETVNSYRKEGKSEDSFEKVQRLKSDIQVISYDVRDISVSSDHNRVQQVVEIHYYKLDQMIEKTLKTEEVWEYDKDQKMWRLRGGFPEFK